MTEVHVSSALTPFATDAAVLTVECVEVTYGLSILGVSDVSLQVNMGEIVALIGANGAGKSTTLKAISGLHKADRARISRGRILLSGVDAGDLEPDARVERGVVHVLEGRRVFSHLTVEENLRAGAFVRHPSRATLREGLERIYTWFPRLAAKRSVRAGYTSGGEQQMLALGRALLTRPRLVLLDEPSMGLAPKIVQDIFQIITSLNQTEGITFLIAEQNSHSALRHAHRGYVLESGRVVLQDSARSLLDREDIRRAYLGAQ